MSEQTFSQKLSDFKTRHELTLPQLCKILGSGARATEYWLSPTKPKLPRPLVQQAVLTTLEAYDRKHRPKAPKTAEAAETPAVA